MKICVMCHYFWPELCAPAARLSEMGEAWADQGHEVTVVTNFPNHPTGTIHPGYENKKFMIEQKGKLRIIRCYTYATPNEGIIKKTMGHLTFAFASVWQAARHLKGTDIIVLSSPPLFSGIGAWLLSKRLRVPYIIEVRDIWPAIFIELGILKNKFLIWILEKFELFLYKQSVHVVTVTESFSDAIRERIEPSKVSTIPNGVDITRYVPGNKSPGLLEEFGVKGKFVVLYLGTHGISQALNSIVNTARLLEDEKEIHFLFIGEGADKKKVMEQAETLNLSNVSFFPSQPKEKVLSIYHCADVCLVPLKNIPLFDTFIPSKMFEVMASGVPLIGCVSGESKSILERSEGGAIICAPENEKELAEKILDYKANPQKYSEMAEKGRDFVSREFNRKELALKYLALITEKQADNGK